MKKYLSIGEVVKMKGVSHRALRHYDDLGILPPAYVNLETGYRYYAKHQMVVLDIIMLCVTLGIPLKQFKNYMSPDGKVDALHMVEDAKEKALERQREIQGQLYFLDTANEHFADAAKLKQRGSCIKHFPERYFLTATAPDDFGNLVDYWTHMTKLYTAAAHNGLALSVNQGLCFALVKGKTQATYFVEVQKPQSEILPQEMLCIPQGDFSCEFFEDACFFEALEKYQSHEQYLAGKMFILSDILETNLTPKAAPFEIQLML